MWLGAPELGSAAVEPFVPVEPCGANSPLSDFPSAVKQPVLGFSRSAGNKHHPLAVSPPFTFPGYRISLSCLLYYFFLQFF